MRSELSKHLILDRVEEEEVAYKCGRTVFHHIFGAITITIKIHDKERYKFYIVSVVPVLLYGSDMWSLTRNDIRKLKAA